MSVSSSPGQNSDPAPGLAAPEIIGSVNEREVPATLVEAAPRTLGLLDQLGLWGNLGVSLLGFAGALAILAPSGAGPLSLPAAVTAIVVGSVLGGLILGTTLVLGARTGAPAMVLLRGLLGAKASFVPTVLNIAQCLGWSVFELVVISQGLQALTRGHLSSWVCVLFAGVVTTALTIKPLGAIRVLRKYVSVLVVLAMVVLIVGLLRHPMGVVSGSWSGFWLAVDAAVALTISWVPLGADYSRHSRTARAAFAGGFLGYGATQIACMLIGVVALAQLQQDPERIFDLFLSLPLGSVAFAVLVLRETDQSFANVYSTAVSIQNMAPRWDRRVLTLLIGAGTTVIALTVDIAQYQNFLYLIGAVFIPLSGALVASWWRTKGIGWDLSTQASVRPGMLASWVGGFIVYQLINPGSIAGWSTFWSSLGRSLHTMGHPWLSASVASFVVAVVLALPFAASKSGQVSPRQAASKNIHS
jgi:NCS1 family nucleobase:cation symporter-1